MHMGQIQAYISLENTDKFELSQQFLFIKCLKSIQNKNILFEF